MEDYELREYPVSAKELPGKSYGRVEEVHSYRSEEKILLEVVAKRRKSKLKCECTKVKQKEKEKGREKKKEKEREKGRREHSKSQSKSSLKYGNKQGEKKEKMKRMVGKIGVEKIEVGEIEVEKIDVEEIGRKENRKAEQVAELLGVEQEAVREWVLAYGYLEAGEIAEKIRQNVKQLKVSMERRKEEEENSRRNSRLWEEGLEQLKKSVETQNSQRDRLNSREKGAIFLKLKAECGEKLKKELFWFIEEHAHLGEKALTQQWHQTHS